MRYANPDGHGRYGILDTDADGQLICHECGQARAFLGRHVRVHGLTAAEYRRAHGLGVSTSLAADTLAARWSQLATDRIGTGQWQRFTAARDPDAARAASMETYRKPLAAETRAQRQRAIAADGIVASRRARRNATVYTCPICGAQWCVIRNRGTKRRTCSDRCYRQLRGWD